MKAYTESERRWIWLSSVNGMTAHRFYRLLERCEDPAALWDEPEEYLYDTDDKLKAEMLRAHDEAYVDAFFEDLEKHGITALTRDSEGYPDALQHIHDAPPTLYVKGCLTLEYDRSLAVVGTRNTTYLGEKAARDLSGGLSRHGVTIISGLARGIDTCAHAACLESGGHTIAVLGNGLNSIYPPENADLARRILDSGGSLVSELRPQDSPTRWSFPRRNRIISGLSKGTLVVEGTAKSGAMITANFALDEGKDVYAVPGSPYDPNSEGPNLLIQNGAYPALSYWDILEGERWESRSSSKRLPDMQVPELDPDEKTVYDALKKQALSFDELASFTLFSVSKLNSCLTMLELRGIIVKLPGNLIRLA